MEERCIGGKEMGRKQGVGKEDEGKEQAQNEQ